MLSFQLLSEYGKNPNITHLVDTFDWYVVPVTNPDGYVYTWNGVSDVVKYLNDDLYIIHVDKLIMVENE